MDTKTINEKVIRKATRADFAQVCPLILAASAIVFKDALKTNDTTLLKKQYQIYYLSPSTKFSYLNTVVYEIAGKIVGAISGYDSALEEQYNTAMRQLLLFGEHHFVKEALPNTFYLDSCGVDPDYRKQGIASALITYMITSEKQDLSLLVETTKPKAEALYQSLGFKNKGQVKAFGVTLHKMIYTH